MSKFNVNFLISTFFGVGKLPSKIVYLIASCIALPFSYLCFYAGLPIIRFLFPSPFPFQEILSALFVLIVFTMVAVKAAGLHAKKIRDKDPAEIIIDEVIGQSLAFIIALPLTTIKIYLLPSDHYLAFINKDLLMLAGIILNIGLFRFFDSFKPWPIYLFENMKGGMGIVMDDIAAGIYTTILYLLILFSL